VAEGGGLLNRYGSKAHRRFESCYLRQFFRSIIFAGLLERAIQVTLFYFGAFAPAGDDLRAVFRVSPVETFVD
jgi:hypothetical protein